VMRLIVLTMAVSWVAFVADPASAAQIRILGIRSDDALMVDFVGEIQPRDSATLKRFLEAHISNVNRLRIIVLNSDGGDVTAAMQIGRYLRSLEFDTAVFEGARCLSSCVFILASGLSKDALPNHVGIHRPFGTNTGSMSRDDATKKYRELTTQVYAYFEEMNLPRRLPEEMLRIPPEEMKMLSEFELEQFGLVGKDPVAQERDDAANAARFGITRREYLTRRSRALETCKVFASAPASYTDCYYAILGGKK